MKHTNKRKISMILVLAMVLSVLPLNLITVHAASSSYVQTAINTAVGATAPADVRFIDISNNESVIGHLDVVDLKTTYTNLEYINVKDTNVTKITSAPGVQVVYDGTFVGGQNARIRSINWEDPGSSSVLTYDISDPAKAPIAIDDLLGQLKITQQGSAAKAIPADLMNNVTYTIDVATGGTPVTAQPGDVISTATLDALDPAQPHTIDLQITLEGTSAPLPVFSHTLSVLDASYELEAPSSPYTVYENNKAEFIFTMKNSVGDVEEIGDINTEYSFNIYNSSNGLSSLTPNTPYTQISAGIYKIEVDIPDPTSLDTYTIKVTNTLNTREAKATFTVDSLPAIAAGTVSLYEKNDSPQGNVPSGPLNATQTYPLYIRGGTDVASSDSDNVLGQNTYTNETIFELHSTTGPISADYVNAITITDPSGNVTGKAFNKDGNAVVKFSAVPKVGPGGGQLPGVATISIQHGGGTSTITINYEITPSPAQVYEVYQLSESFAQTLPSSAQLLQAIADGDVQVVKKVVQLDRSGNQFPINQDPNKSPGVELIENTNAYLVITARYGAEETSPLYVVPSPAITKWGGTDQFNPLFETGTSHAFTGTQISGQIVSNLGGSSALKVAAASGSGGQEANAFVSIDDGTGQTYGPLSMPIAVRSKNIKNYIFSKLGAPDPLNGKITSNWNDSYNLSERADAERTIPIGGEAEYKIWVVYDNDDIEAVSVSGAGLTPASGDTSAFTAAPGSGSQLVVQATTEGGANDARARANEKAIISVTDGSGKKGEVELILGHSLIKGLTYWIQAPEGIDAYEGVGNRTSSTCLEKLPINKEDLASDQALELPRGLEGKVWVVPEFANTEMYTGTGWKDYALTGGYTLTSPSESNSANSITAPVADANKALVIKSEDVKKPINDLIRARFEVTTPSIGITIGADTTTYPVDSTLTSISTEVPIKITEPVLQKMVVEQYDPAIDDYNVLDYDTTANVYEISGHKGEEVKLRAKVVYSDGHSVDILGGNLADTFAKGVYFMPKNSLTDYNQNGNITHPSASNFITANDTELSVLHGYFMSQNPTEYHPLVNSGTPVWNNNLSPDAVNAQLRSLTKGIGIQAFKDDITPTVVADDSITADYLTKPGTETVVPGHFAVKLQKQGSYLLAFSGSYNANGFADETWVEDLDHPGQDLRIRVKVDQPKVERIYLVGSSLSYDSANGAYVFDNTPDGSGVKKFNIYPVVLDTSWYMANGEQTALPNRLSLSQVGVADSGINYMKADEWELNSDNTIGTWSKNLSSYVTIASKKDSNNHLYLEVTVTGNIADTNLTEISLDLNNRLTQSPNTHRYAANASQQIDPQPSNPTSIKLYTTSDDVVQDIKIDAPASGTDVEMGDHIDFNISYLMRSNAEIALDPSEIPGGAGYVAGAANALMVTADPSNPGSATFTANGGNTLRFTPTALGEYKFKLTSMNTLGEPVPNAGLSDRIVTFNVVPATLSPVTVHYGEKVAIPGLPSTAAYLLEENGSALNPTTLGQLLVEMNQNQSGNTTIGVYDSSNNKIAEVDVTLMSCTANPSLIPTSNAGAPLAFAPGQTIGLQFKVEYVKTVGPATVTKTEFFDVTSLTLDYGDGFLTLANSKATADVPSIAGSYFDKYKASNGTFEVFLFASMDSTAIAPTYSYRVVESGSPTTGFTLGTLGGTKTVELQRSADGGTIWTNVDDYTVTSNDSSTAYATRTGSARTTITAISNGTADITFSPLLGGSANITVVVDIPPVNPPAGNTFTVTYFGNGNDGGTAPTDPQNPYNAGSIATVMDENTLSKTGETFVGWNTEANGSGTPYVAGAHITMNSDVRLYAQWSGGGSGQYTVTYDANGGVGSVPADSNNPYNANDLVTVLDEGSLVKTGENFTGWNTAADGSGTAYQPNSTFNIISNVRLYAQWMPAPVGPGQIGKWTLAVNNSAWGSATAENQSNQVYQVGPSTEIIVNDVLTLKATSNRGYEFVNWSVSPSASGTLSNSNSTVTNLTLDDDSNHMTITANFKAETTTGPSGPTGGGGGGSVKDPTLTFNVNGGKAISSVTKSSGSVINLKDYSTTRAGYTFEGWYKESGLVTKITSVTLNSSTTVYAKWEKAAGEEETPLGNSDTVDNTGISGLITDDHFAYISGYADGSIAPDRQMLRAEVAQMFYNLLSDKSMGSQAASFTDVKSGDWYEEAVKTLASKGIITGYENGTFNPNGNITRAEFATMASRFGNLKAGTISFSDVPTSFWGYDAIANVYARGWVNGYQDGTFMPNKVITRAEVIKITNSMLNRFADKNFVDSNQNDIAQFTDLTKSHWAYYVIMEATRAHEFTSSNGVETWDNLE